MNAQPDELASATPAAPEAPRRLPFAYAKRHGVLVNQWDNGRAIVWCRPDVSAATLAEVRRYLGAPITLESIDTARIDYQLRQAYEHGASEAMDIMGDLGDDNMDLSRIAQALPEPEDLLESEDDAPIIRLINALLTEAVKENASDIRIEPYGHRHARAHRQNHPPAARHHAGDRPDRFGQDHDAVCRAHAPQRPPPQHHDRGRPDRILPRRHQSDAREYTCRDDLRARALRDSAPGPGRGDGGRDTRFGDGRDRRAGEPHRPPRALDPAHQQRGGRGDASPRHGRRAVSALVESHRCIGAAPRAPALQQVQAAVYPERGRLRAFRLRRRAAAHFVYRGRVQSLQSIGLQRSHRHLRTPRNRR